MYQAWTYGDYVLRDSRSLDVPVIAALEWACQSHPWQLERVEAFLTVPHESHEQFGLVASLEGRPVGYAILGSAAAPCRSNGSACSLTIDASEWGRS